MSLAAQTERYYSEELHYENEQLFRSSINIDSAGSDIDYLFIDGVRNHHNNVFKTIVLPQSWWCNKLSNQMSNDTLTLKKDKVIGHLPKIKNREIVSGDYINQQAYEEPKKVYKSSKLKDKVYVKTFAFVYTVLLFMILIIQFFTK